MFEKHVFTCPFRSTSHSGLAIQILERPCNNEQWHLIDTADFDIVRPRT